MHSDGGRAPSGYWTPHVRQMKAGSDYSKGRLRRDYAAPALQDDDR